MFEHIIWCPSRFYFGPLLLQISFYLNCDIDFASYADDTSPNICGQNFNNVIKMLEANVNRLMKCFGQNGLLAKSGKSHLPSLY